jgi:hypothetical protein
MSQLFLAKDTMEGSDPEQGSQSSQPKSPQKQKPARITCQSAALQQYETSKDPRAKKSIEHSFEPGQGPGRIVPTPGEPSIIPSSFLAHRKYPGLDAGIDEEGSPTVDRRFCGISGKWLKTGTAVQNGERDSERQHSSGDGSAPRSHSLPVSHK